MPETEYPLHVLDFFVPRGLNEGRPAPPYVHHWTCEHPTEAEAMAHKAEIDGLAPRVFKDLPFEEQAQRVLANVQFLGSFLNAQGLSYFTTCVLRADCGCDLTYFDEMTQQFVELDAHGPGCHRVRWPIIEDWSDRTIQRRNKRNLTVSDFQEIEESAYAGA